MNNGINPAEFTKHYITIDRVICMVSQFGQGALMAKFEVETAYRNIAVHMPDRYLLGMNWRNQFYIDLALPFALRSAPHIFNSVQGSKNPLARLPGLAKIFVWLVNKVLC